MDIDIASTSNQDNSSNENMTEDIPKPSSSSAMESSNNAKPDGNDFVPQLENVTFGELNIAVKVLKAVAALTPKKNKRKPNNNNNNDNKNEENVKNIPTENNYQHPNLRPLRKVLAQCMELQKRTMYQGKTEEDYYQERLEARTLKRQKMAEQVRQKKYIADTALRKGRLERLKEKQSEAKDEENAKVQSIMMMMIPDGHVETTTTVSSPDDATTPALLMTSLPNDTHAVKEEEEPTVHLPKLRSCYVCKTRYRELHSFYDQLCPPCAAMNWQKRHQKANLTGKVAVVTGSRVKIGYQTCLKLLRSGATVVATTRFPNAAAATYRQEADFDRWKDRLQVYGLDLRDVTGIEAFCRFMKLRYSESGLDILINNACQTVRRPTAYYLPTCQKEEELWKQADGTHKKLLGGCLEFERVRRRLLLEHKNATAFTSSPSLSSSATHVIHAGNKVPLLGSGTTLSSSEGQGVQSQETAVVATVPEDALSENSTKAPFECTGISHSAAMSQTILLPEDVGVSDAILPPGVTDINGQQLDLRKTNSWLLKIEQVSTPEVMECMFINAIAPFVLNSRLKPLMTIPNAHEDRYIINVSAMEGKFYRYKMANHPHTNMAKAALNMMTRTSAEDLAKNHGIYMNSVDTGWINDENPLERANKTAKTNLFQTPIDEIDAAARILDPIFTGVNEPNKEKDYGKFLKDYRETEW